MTRKRPKRVGFSRVQCVGLVFAWGCGGWWVVCSLGGCERIILRWRYFFLWDVFACVCVLLGDRRHFCVSLCVRVPGECGGLGLGDGDTRVNMSMRPCEKRTI